ncbi:MAG: HIT family hydrolase [Candidatus Omnitrophota bacterium]|nr:MAG: HIT family hydrolase [Candidatus Omnitrophota bacterium]RKY36402.1 MAG: HIT family hydrolase [Candidatus Omnitrophota bacterium]RKY45826.1 MAG: HIT family hydrolase [Candidatus Omnitrophota bacterium]HDN85819.1 HIT domain-containing protein [Candidatus Omnitrophota bacterium]
MEQLWAPWRIRYIQKDLKKKKGCIFCRAYRSKKDKDNFLILRTPHVLAILNIFPYNNGHLMVAPKRHIGDLEKLSVEESLELVKVVKSMISILKKVLKPDGFNIGMNIGKSAGAGIEKHLHIHIVPRWIGDTNFMPVCSNSKVISQSLNELYFKLKRCLQEKR